MSMNEERDGIMKRVEIGKSARVGELTTKRLGTIKLCLASSASNPGRSR